MKVTSTVILLGALSGAPCAACPTQPTARGSEPDDVKARARELVELGCINATRHLWNDVIRSTKNPSLGDGYRFSWGELATEYCGLRPKKACTSGLRRDGLTALQAFVNSSDSQKGKAKARKMIEELQTLPPEPTYWPAIAAGTGALVAGGLGLWAGFEAQSSYDAAAALGPKATGAEQIAACGTLSETDCRSKKKALNADGNDWETTGYVLAGVAAVGVGLAVWLTLDPVMDDGLLLVPSISPTGAGLALGGSF